MDSGRLGSMKKIAIVTTQFPKLTEAGGIAFVTGRLAHSFVEAGHKVDVIVVRTQIKPSRSIIEHYKIFGIRLITVSSDLYEVSPWWLSTQLNIDRTILDGNYDVVICQEWQGLLALTSGLNLQRPPIITWLHGGVLYDRTGSERDFSHKLEFIDAVLEEAQIAKSALVVSPSKYLINFYSDYGWRISNTRVIPYLLPGDLPAPSLSNGRAEIVVAFVGALSVRKGFDQFLVYVQELAKSGLSFSIRVFGKPYDIDEKMINDALLKTGVKYIVESDFNPIEIWEQLNGLNVTLVVPSRMDNSPGVIYEAISAGAKVLVSESNGGAELSVLFEKQIQIIGQNSILTHLGFIQSLSNERVNIGKFNAEICTQWENLLDETIIESNLKREKAEKSFNKSNPPTISVVITTKNRPDFFKASLNSVLGQSLLPNEIIVVEDTSDGQTDVASYCHEISSPVPICYYNADLYASRNASVGTTKLCINKLAANARNFGASKSTCEVISFLDDDNIYFPSHLQDSVKCLIAESAVAVTSFLGQLPSTKPLSLSTVPTQIGVMAGSHFGALNLIANVSMDSEILIYRNTFESVGGFPLDSAPEDWGLALYLMANNHKIATTGNVSIKYRLNNTGIMASMASANKRWWELDRSSVSKYWAPESAWWINHLARNHFMMGEEFGIAIQNKSYIKYGLSLIKKGQLGLLVFGVKKYFFRRKFL
jgi:glycosyltransferase involved in cell wall biosynthesis